MVNGNTIKEEEDIANILSKQYEAICSNPRESIYSLEFTNSLLDKSDIDGTCTPNMSTIDIRPCTINRNILQSYSEI